MAEKDKEETYTVKPNSQVDLERRLDEDYVSDSDIRRNIANPNPFGGEDYAGTDPIYQNHANDIEVPLRAEEGPDKLAEDHVRELHNLDDVDDGELTEDYGLGGQATKAGNPNNEAERYLVPGQEGYPDNPEKYTGPAVPASAVEADQGKDDDKDHEVAKGDAAAQSSTPRPAGTQPPTPDKRGDNDVTKK